VFSRKSAHGEKSRDIKDLTLVVIQI